MNHEEATAFVAQLVESHGFIEVDRVVATFDGYRETRTGETQRVRIEVTDGGDAGHQLYRYNVRVTREDGKLVTGNGDRTIKEALSIVHWEELEIP